MDDVINTEGEAQVRRRELPPVPYAKASMLERVVARMRQAGQDIRRAAYDVRRERAREEGGARG